MFLKLIGFAVLYILLPLYREMYMKFILLQMIVQQ